MDFNLMVANVRRAMSLDRSFYREVADDPRYSQEALMVVILAAALSGVGSFLTQLFGGNFFGSIIALMVGVVLAVVGYYIWAYVVQWLGAAMFKGQGTAPELLRGLGYAYGPMALGIFAFIPCVGGLVAAVGAIWALVCGFFAVPRDPQDERRPDHCHCDRELAGGRDPHGNRLGGDWRRLWDYRSRCERCVRAVNP